MIDDKESNYINYARLNCTYEGLWHNFQFQWISIHINYARHK